MERMCGICKNVKSENCVSLGVAPAGARVPLRGPMTRGDYGELSMIQFYEIDQLPYRRTFPKFKR